MKWMKYKLMDSMRLMGDNQRTMDAVAKSDAMQRALQQRIREAQAMKEMPNLSPPANTPEDMATTYRIDSPDSVNHYYPAQQPPAPAPAPSPVGAPGGSGTLGKLALGAGLIMGTAGLGLGAYGALKPAPAPITQTITTPAPEVVPWVSFDGGKTWKEQPIEGK